MKILKNLTAHYVFQNGDAILSRRNRLYLYHHETGKTEHLLTLPYRRSLLNYNRFNIITRLLRAEVFHVIAKDVNHFLVFFDHRIFKIEIRKITNVFTIPTCRRPINVYYDGGDTLIWGDYVDSKTRRLMSIYVSHNFGTSWDKIYTFKLGSIKHIHNIQYDPFRQHYWILTGDNDAESGLWITEDLKTITPFLIGEQKYRTVSIIIEKDGLIIPSDTERERNFIRYYSFADQKLFDLQEVNGSCMFAKKINNNYFVTTMYEPSLVNKHKYAEIWHSSDGQNWKVLLSLKKDLLPEKIFQYPIIKIPEYEADFKKKTYIFSTRAVKGGSDTIFISVT